MALIMNEEQRQKTLEEYNPKEHLIPVGKDRQGKQTMYYPAAWRLYELHLRYPNANFKSEIIYHDEQKGTVIVKAYLYLGKNYEESDKKAESMKQGNISALDKVETAAKARCARDFGIGTEYALDMTADETDATHDAPVERQERQQAGQDVRRSVHTQNRKTDQETHPSDAQAQSKPSNFAEIERLLDEYQKLFPDWCEKTPHWRNGVIRKGLDISKEQPLPKGEDYTEDDVHRFSLFLVSKQQEAKRTKESAA